MAHDMVTIGRVGWVDEELLDASAISFSRQVDGPGQLVCTVPHDDLYDRGYDVRPGDLPIKGAWVRLEHPTAGTWAGVVTQTRVDGSWVELTAESFHVLLRKRRVPTDYVVSGVPAGSVALRAFTDVQRLDYTWVGGVSADEDGDPIEVELRGGDLVDDVFRELVGVSGMQWRVTPERVLEWRHRLGSDKRGTVTLVEGAQISGVDQTGDLWTMVNALTGTSSDARWADTTAYELESDDSLRDYGRRYEELRAYPYASRSTIIPHVRDDLRRLRDPAELIRLDVIDDGESWADVREGDIITAILPSVNAVVVIDVMAQDFDLDRGVMSIAGKVLAKVDE